MSPELPQTIYTFFLIVVNKDRTTLQERTLQAAILWIPSPHIHPNSDFHFPLNSHSSSHLAFCCYTLFYPGQFFSKVLSIQSEAYSRLLLKVWDNGNELSKPLKIEYNQVPCRSQQREFPSAHLSSQGPLAPYNLARFALIFFASVSESSYFQAIFQLLSNLHLNILGQSGLCLVGSQC